MNQESWIAKHAAEWVGLRRQIHANPELCFAEFQTAGLIERQLRQWGIETHTGLGGTGVVGVIRARNSHAGRRRIGIRADMDALPIQEKNSFPHASRNPGKMHACGHDGHVAMLLGAAHIWSIQPPESTDVLLIFQPAEEGGGGAQRMIDDGLFSKFPVDFVYAMHNWPGLPAGSLAVKPGPMMASSNEFHLTVRGRGAHAAMPHLGIDPIPIACQIVNQYQTIVSRIRDPFDPAVISVTQFNAGDTTNVIPEFAKLAGTVRTFATATLDRIEDLMHTISTQTAEAMGARSEFQFQRNYPATINDVVAVDHFLDTIQRQLPETSIQTDINPSMGAEDFAFMLKEVPGAYIWIGNGSGEHRENGHGMGPCMLHNPSYDFNDQILPAGVRTWLALCP